nr:tubulin polyglutamylase TTLL4-like isoform X1 [Onthophagus taurus]XP_022900398.1 tubulin polyglutamylase TTLL4-like isoform X1 [Onthophagus taurus]
MAECNVAFSFPPIRDGRICKYSYATWCPTCDRDSPRRRTKSETNEFCRRKGKDMKTFTPKKHSRCHRDNETFQDCCQLKYDRFNLTMDCCQPYDWQGYENCQIFDDCHRFDTACDRFEGSCQNARKTRANSFATPNVEPFELPTTYIDGYNANMSNPPRYSRVPSRSSTPDNLHSLSATEKRIRDIKMQVLKAQEKTISPSSDHHPPQISSIYMNAKSIGFSPQEQQKNPSRPETCTFFDKRTYDVNLIRERYHREVEALKIKLQEIQKTRMLAAQLKKQFCDKEIIEVKNIEKENTVEIVKPIKYEMKDKIKHFEHNGAVPKKIAVRRVKSDKLKSDKAKILLKTHSKPIGTKLWRPISSKTKVVNEETCESSSSDDESVKNDENNMRIVEEVIKIDEPVKNLDNIESSMLIGPRPICSDSGNWPLRESLFPHVPPYINFNTYDATQPFIIPTGKRILKWKLSTITPVLIRKTLTNTGFVLVRSEFSRESNDWLGCWGKHMRSPQFQTLKETQKLNHFPGTFQIGRKDRLWRNLQRLMYIHGYKEFEFMPQSFVIPQDLRMLKQCWEEKSGIGNEIFIIKPPASARGTGIKVINKWSQLPKKQSLVVQRYISNPYLINGSKFDLRLYVLVTSFNPLRIYLYPEGLARFASAKYSHRVEDLQDRYKHLTNYSINKYSSEYTANEDAFSCQGHKWTLSKLWEFMEKDGVDTKVLWKKMEDLVIKTMICGESPITQLAKEYMNNRYNCYELFGVDILLDDKLKCWLLEVNISPSLHSASPLDAYVKGPLVKALLDLAQFHLPPKVNRFPVDPNKPIGCFEPKLYSWSLTKREIQKHNFYVQCEDREYLRTILDTLTGDDVRLLIQAEDELTVKGSFDRIFPTSKTHCYFKFMEPRYYNRLFDAWESKYESKRGKGIAVLKRLCSQKIHLKVGSQCNVSKDSQSSTPAPLSNKKTEESIVKPIVSDVIQPLIATTS